jgi:hypothetical protein
VTGGSGLCITHLGMDCSREKKKEETGREAEGCVRTSRYSKEKEGKGGHEEIGKEKKRQEK